MFSWITGPRITDVIEDLQAEPAFESTFIDPPETPAHQFAVKAFKHALFGTPAPDDLNNATRKFERRARLDAAAKASDAKAPELSAPRQNNLSLSPSKRPGGILMTPGTARGRKTVSFGSQVEDNEGKRGGIAKSGIPNDCPGKFPSPWTPGTELRLDSGSDKRPRTKLTEALMDARTTTQPKSGQKPKARDDSDITIDLGAPRSDSGKYWKEQYESYAERSEKEMKQVIAKQQLAKKFAMKKDGEVTDLAAKLDQERKRFRQRERELELQNKDYQERLRQALAESASSSIEIATLKARIATLERGTSAAEQKIDFQIYEDIGKEAVRAQMQPDRVNEVPFAPSMSASSGKENSSPRPRCGRRQTLPDASDRTTAPRLGAAQGEASIILGKSPSAAANAFSTSKLSIEPLVSAQPSKSPLSIRKPSPLKENTGPKSPDVMLPSSPLPMPSPDPWMNMHESSIPELDKMALPIASGMTYTRAEWKPPPKQHRTSRSVPNASKTDSHAARRYAEKEEKPSYKTEKPAHELEARLAALSSKPTKKHDIDTSRVEVSKKTESTADSRFDISRITAHHAEGSAQVKRDRAEILPADRKAQARKRLEERKRLRKNAPT
jgi:hypothetical protein